MRLKAALQHRANASASSRGGLAAVGGGCVTLRGGRGLGEPWRGLAPLYGRQGIPLMEARSPLGWCWPSGGYLLFPRQGRSQLGEVALALWLLLNQPLHRALSARGCAGTTSSSPRLKAGETPLPVVPSSGQVRPKGNFIIS